MSGRKSGRAKTKAESCIWRTDGIKKDIFLSLSEEHSHSVTLSLLPCLSVQISATQHSWSILSLTTSFQFFYSNCSSCQGFLLFSLIIYSSLSLSLLFPLSPSMVIWTWTKQWLRWHMWLPRSLLRPILFSLSSYLLLLYKNWYFLCL